MEVREQFETRTTTNGLGHRAISWCCKRCGWSFLQNESDPSSWVAEMAQKHGLPCTKPVGDEIQS